VIISFFTSIPICVPAFKPIRRSSSSAGVPIIPLVHSRVDLASEMTASDDQIRRDFERAVDHHRGKQFSEAEALYERILESRPRNGAVLNLLGVIRCQRGDFAGGISLLEQSIGIEKVRETYRNLGLALQIEGRLDDAVAAYRNACGLEPQNPEPRLELGSILLQAGRPLEALTELRAAIDIRSNLAEAHAALGETLRTLGRQEEAQAAYGVALAFKADLADAHLGIAALLLQRHRLEEALAAYLIGLKLKPDALEALAQLGCLLQELGRPEEARDAFRRAFEHEPSSFAARWHLCACHLRPLYRSEEEIDISRTGYERDLHALTQDFTPDKREGLRAAADSLCRQLPFYLPYQGRCDRNLQRTYGETVCRVMQTLHPGFAVRPPMPSLRPGKRIRVGIASSFFTQHSVWKIPTKGWVENLDKARFKLFGYYLGQCPDEASKTARTSFARLTTGPLTVERWAELIRGDELHVLIFPEIGMDGTALQLAALRLAAVQATSFGHPETSGLPSVDYYLSSELTEGTGADAHYTEQLVRLPNLGIHYTPPTPPHVDLTRADIGLRADATVYWCCQALYKYLPQHDSVFPSIAKLLTDCQFIFIDSAQGATVSDVFRDRLTHAFARHGLSMQDHCVFLTPMDFARFNAVARLSDVFLDSIGWSGFNSILESLVWDIAPVILPGEMMRARQSAAVMKMMGVTETVATDIAAYVNIAARLGLDRAWRQAVAARIRENKHKLCNDTESVRGLEDFLVRAAAR
jgi:protein O-GlcNAc transferase